MVHATDQYISQLFLINVLINVLSYSGNFMKNKKITSASKEVMIAFGFTFLMSYSLPF